MIKELQVQKNAILGDPVRIAQMAQIAGEGFKQEGKGVVYYNPEKDYTKYLSSEIIEGALRFFYMFRVPCDYNI